MSSTIEQAMIAATPTELVSGQPPPVSKEGLRTFATVVSGEVAAVSETVTTDRRVVATWSALSAIAGTQAAQGAEVLDSDSGTHTDPVVGGTVANAGVYSWSVSPAGWKRIGSTGISSKADKSTALGGSGLAVASGTLGASPAIDVPIATSSDMQAGTADDLAVTPALWAVAFAVAMGVVAQLQKVYTSAGDRVPLIGAANGVLLGVDAASGAPYGAMVDGLQAIAGGTLTPATLLDDVDYDMTTDRLVTVLYGQSNAVGAQGTPLITTTAKYGALMFAGGVKAAVGTDTETETDLVEDELGEEGATGTNRGETGLAQAAREISERAAAEDDITPGDVVVFASAPGEGGKQLSELSKGTAIYTRLLGHVTAAVALAVAGGREAYVVMGLVQLEADSTGTTTGAAYAATLRQFWTDLDADVRAATGQSGAVHLCVAIPTFHILENGGPVLGMMEVLGDHDHIHLVAPMYFLPYDADETHLTALGHAWLGRYFGRAWKAIALDHVRPPRLWPLTAVARGTQIRVTFEVPRGPLVIDTALGEATAYGFRVVDGGGTVDIVSVVPDGPEEVVITTDVAASGATVVRYALDYLGAGLGIDQGTSGNLRDSTQETAKIDGAARSLAHWCPPFQLVAHILET